MPQNKPRCVMYSPYIPSSTGNELTAYIGGVFGNITTSRLGAEGGSFFFEMGALCTSTHSPLTANFNLDFHEDPSCSPPFPAEVSCAPVVFGCIIATLARARSVETVCNHDITCRHHLPDQTTGTLRMTTRPTTMGGPGQPPWGALDRQQAPKFGRRLAQQIKAFPQG